MIFTLSIILSLLVLANFILLKFSCNKTDKPEKQKQESIVINRPIPQKEISTQLAATGS